MSQSADCKFAIGSTVTVKCKASKGVLPHEVGILIRGTDQFYESLVDDDLVRLEDGDLAGGEQEAFINAQVVNDKCENVLVELPRQVVTAGRRIWVPKSEVTAYGNSVAAGN